MNEIHDHKEELSPVTNYSQPFRSQKEGNLKEKKKDPIASRKLVLLKATKRLVRTLSAILSLIFVQKDCHSYR